MSQAHLDEVVREVASAIRQEKRVETGKHLMMLGNLAAGAPPFGQASSGFPFNLRVAALGVTMLLLAYFEAWFLMDGGWREMSSLLTAPRQPVDAFLIGIIAFIASFSLVLNRGRQKTDLIMRWV